MFVVKLAKPLRAVEKLAKFVKLAKVMKPNLKEYLYINICQM